MGNFRCFLAVCMAKIIAVGCRIKGSRGTATPGKYALRLCPDLIERLSKTVRGKTIVVSGTNGKTTTNNLINTALAEQGYKTVCNREGANMLNGIATAYALAQPLFFGKQAHYACIEADEATLPLLFERSKPDILVITNLFRDQLDRYGEIDITLSHIQKALGLAEDAVLVLNADDPVTSTLGMDRNAVYYGIGENAASVVCDEIRDGANCRICGKALDYSYYSYGQLGAYTCGGCGYQTPQADYCAKGIQNKDGLLRFGLEKAKDVCFESEVTGLYNVYNMLAAAAALDQIGIDTQRSSRAFLAHTPLPGRMNSFEIDGKKVYLILSKNPTGFNQSVATVVGDTRDKDILLVLNDNPQDGEDISWIWDTDFESMDRPYHFHYTITGERRFDLYLRLKYAGFDTNRITVCEDIETAVKTMLARDGILYYALVNYTAMYPTHLVLTKLEGRKG